jgi:sugar phosphate isomerase/epimerase
MMKRRKFLQASIIAPTLLSWRNQQRVKTNLEIKVMNTSWGFNGSFDEYCGRTKTLGYDGVEIWWPSKDEQKEIFDALQKHELAVGFLIAGHSPDFANHKKEFEHTLKAVCDNKNQKPLYINCHSGKDYFTFKENSQLIEMTIEQEAKCGIEILHETHRGRMCFAAPVTRDFLNQYPDMKLTLDISHWCNVHESMLENQKETIEFALTRVGHIHARIGHEEGPQVNDPRAPEWSKHVDQHLSWWDTVLGHREKMGKKTMTFLTEFGPPTYLPTLPYTQQPVADQWAINTYMKDLVRGRYTR